MTIEEIKHMTAARIRSLTKYLEGKDPHSSWRMYSKDYCMGRLAEAKNTLGILNQVVEAVKK